MDSTKQEPEDISGIIVSNLLELDGSVKEEPEDFLEDLNVLEFHRPKYRCNQCTHLFETREILRSHQENHHKNARNKCSKYGLQFGTRKDFREHQSQMGNFECLLCEKAFECESARSQHLERDHEKDINQLSTLQNKEQSKLEAFDIEMKFQCDHCGLSFDKKQNLRNHMMKFSHLKFVTSCEECGFRSRDLTWHRRSYSGYFNCSRKNCKKKFKCKRAFRNHSRDEHEQNWKCPECPEIFKARKQLRTHRDKQHNKKFQCDLCELAFLKERILSHHKWKVHEKDMDISQLSCDECGKIFRTRDNLRKHKMQTDHQIFQSPNVNENSSGSIVSVKKEQKKSSTVKENESDPAKRNRVSCRECGRKFADRVALKAHQKRWSRFKCNICDQEFQCKFGLAQHTRQDHEKDPKCRKCPFVGKDLSALRTHCYSRHKVQSLALQHLVEVSDTHKKYACSKCGLEFGTRKGFREHQSQMGNFKCLFCDEEFECEYARSQHLERNHEKHKVQLATLLHKKSSKLETLDVEMKFQCDYCGLSFDKKYKLIYHISVHVKFISSCEECGFKSRDLTWHRKKYSGNFKCLWKNCDEVFKCKLALKIHARDEHEQNWKCPECPEILKTRKKFKSHCTKFHRNIRDIAKPLRVSKNTNYDHKSHPKVASNKQEMTSEINQRLDDAVKNEQKDSSETESETETLGMNIHVKEEPEVSYVLKLPSGEEKL